MQGVHEMLKHPLHGLQTEVKLSNAIADSCLKHGVRLGIWRPDCCPVAVEA